VTSDAERDVSNLSCAVCERLLGEPCPVGEVVVLWLGVSFFGLTGVGSVEASDV